MPSKDTAPILLKLITPIFLKNRPKPFDKKFKSVFILSTGRTGTKFFASYFGPGSGVTALHEPKPSRILRMWSMAYMEGKVSDEYMLRVLAKKRRKIISSVETLTYLESNPYLIGFAGLLDKIFKDPIIIHVVRDPRDFARSSVNHGNSVGLKRFFNNYVPYWYPKVEKILNISKLERMDYRAAAYWKVANQHLARIGKGSKNYHVIRFEDIFDEKHSGLQQIEKIIGIKPSGAKKVPVVNKSKRSIIGSWEGWGNEQCRKVDKLCQPEMKQYGYGLEVEWKKRLR